MDQDSASSAVAREFGMSVTVVADIKKTREMIKVCCVLKHKVVYSSVKKKLYSKKSLDDAFDRATYTANAYLV